MALQQFDDNGQPFIPGYNRKRVSDRTIDELIGLAKGITADGKINKLEAEFLYNWMQKNISYCGDPITNIIFARIKEMLIDDILDQEEQQELLELLKSITGEQYSSGMSVTTPATFPLNTPPPAINASGAVFCMTGTFAYGPRKVCAQATIDRGGIVKNSITQETDYLVIGNLCSPEWIHTSYGRKIEKAVLLQKEKPFTDIKIIHEDHWAKHIFSDEKNSEDIGKANQALGVIGERPKRKTRLSLPGTIINLTNVTDLTPGGILERHCEEVLPNFQEKGWCIFTRSGYVGLTGYEAKTKDHVPIDKRKKTAQYKDFTNNKNEPKTKIFSPRNNHIISIAYTETVDKNGKATGNKWEVKTHWTIKRNLFNEFSDAWNLFLEIEQRYDPGLILWTKLDEYDAFEEY